MRDVHGNDSGQRAQFQNLRRFGPVVCRIDLQGRALRRAKHRLPGRDRGAVLRVGIGRHPVEFREGERKGGGMLARARADLQNRPAPPVKQTGEAGHHGGIVPQTGGIEDPTVREAFEV